MDLQDIERDIEKDCTKVKWCTIITIHQISIVLTKHHSTVTSAWAHHGSHDMSVRVCGLQSTVTLSQLAAYKVT